MTPEPTVSEEFRDPSWVAVSIEDNRWTSGVDGAWNGGEAAAEVFVRRAVAAALRAIEVPAAAVEVSALLTDDARMKALNTAFRDAEKATNVLSWPALSLKAPITARGLEAWARRAPTAEGPVFVGDVALGFETVAAEASAAEKRLEDHAAHLIVHGVLHLFGFSHEMDENAAVMERRETEALATLGVADPYATGFAPQGS